jgi:hypothetical protein
MTNRKTLEITKSKSVSTMKGSELRLDFDGDATLDEDVLAFVLETLDEKIYRREEFKTARGHHICLMLHGDYPALAIVAMQSILGSDRKREAFNLQRALVLGSAPAFWQFRWNVLYAEKLGRLDTMINPDEFGQGLPSLKVDDIGDADVAVLTVSEVETRELEQDGVQRQRLLLRFDEFPEKGYWCNVTAVKTLVGKLGNNEARWVGKSVPLVRANTTNPQTKTKVDVLWVASGEQWDDLIAQSSGRRKRGRPTKKAAAAKKASAKKTAKRRQ